MAFKSLLTSLGESIYENTSTNPRHREGDSFLTDEYLSGATSYCITYLYHYQTLCVCAGAHVRACLWNRRIKSF